MTKVLEVRGATVRAAGGAVILRDVELSVGIGEHWAVIGANGAGKSTLLGLVQGAVASAAGEVTVAGEPHGAPGLRDPRLRIGALEGRPRTYAAALTGLEVVTLRPPGPIAVLGAAPLVADRDRGRQLLQQLGAGRLTDRKYASCSQGERQRILLARALMRDPALVLLDEPVAALDLPSRETLLRVLEDLARERPELATLTVTHHLEELPETTTHAMLLRDGVMVAAGPAEEVLRDGPLTECFGLPISVVHQRGRWLAGLAAPAAALS